MCHLLRMPYEILKATLSEASTVVMSLPNPNNTSFVVQPARSTRCIKDMRHPLGDGVSTGL